MAELAKKIASAKTLGRDYHIHVRTGVVENTDTRSETEVTGNISGGGGYSSNGSGFNNPVSGSVQSKTTRYQNIFLKDEDGDDHAVELVDFLIPCKEGQKLTLFLVKSQDNLYGPYFQAYNHNTRQHYENAKAVSSEMFPLREALIASLAVAALFFLLGLGDGFGKAVLLGLVGAVVGGGLAWVAGKVIGAIRAGNVRKNPEFKRFLAGLASG